MGSVSVGANINSLADLKHVETGCAAQKQYSGLRTRLGRSLRRIVNQSKVLCRQRKVSKNKLMGGPNILPPAELSTRVSKCFKTSRVELYTKEIRSGSLSELMKVLR